MRYITFANENNTINIGFIFDPKTEKYILPSLIVTYDNEELFYADNDEWIQDVKNFLTKTSDKVPIHFSELLAAIDGVNETTEALLNIFKDIENEKIDIVDRL